MIRRFLLAMLTTTVLGPWALRAEQESNILTKPDGKPAPTVTPKNQGFHYNRNAERYLETGIRLGWAMADVLKPESK